MKRITRRTTAIMAVTIGLGIAGATTAIAASVLSSSSPETSYGQINGCYASDGALSVQTGTSCTGSTPITWVGKAIEATVQPDGTYGSAYGITSITHPSTGVYDIFTKLPKNGGASCEPSATLAFNPGQVSVEGDANFVQNEVQVQTYDPTGNPADQTFSFLEVCN